MAKIETRDLGNEFGVEVMGVAPRIPLHTDEIFELRRLFDDRGLIVFRGIEVDFEFQTYLSNQLIGAPAPPVGQQAERFVSNREPEASAPYGRLLYHSDMMWSEEVYRVLSLYGVKVDQPASPTMFVSTERAWETLPGKLRERVEGRFAIHGQDATYHKRADGDADVLVSTFAEEETIRLPIGHRHPRTGRTLLYVSQQMTHRIDGMTPAESEALLEELFEHLYRPANVLEHRWREGDLVVWDNIALQHARPNITLGGPTRTLRKVLAPVLQMSAINAPRFSQVGR